MKRILGGYYFLFYAAMAASVPFLSLYLTEAGMNAQQTGVILAVGVVTGIVVQPVLGLLNDRAKDARLILLLSSILAPAFFAGYYFAHGFLLYMVVSVASAVVSNAASPILDSIAITEGEHRGFSYGEIRLWGALGFALAAVAAGYLYHVWSVSWCFPVYVILSLPLVAFAWLLPKGRTNRRQEPDSRARDKNAAHKEPFFAAIWQLTRQRQLMLFVLICTLTSITSSVNFNFLPLYFNDLHYPMSLVGLNFTVAALVEVPFFFVSGKVIERFGRLPILVTATLVFAVKYTVMALAPPVSVVIAVQVLDGIGFSLVWSASVDMVNYLAPKGKKATAQTLFGAIAGGLSNVIGSAGGGAILNHFGAQAMYWAIAVVSIAAAVLFVWFSRTAMKSVPQQESISLPMV